MFILHRHGFLFADSHGESVDRAYGALIRRQLDDLSSVIDKTIEAFRTIIGDKGLTEKGRHERIGLRATEAVVRIRELSASRRKMLDQDLARAQKEVPQRFPMPRLNKDQIVPYHLKLQEIRQHLLQLSDMDRATAINSAAETNDIDLLVAVQESPTVLRLATDALLSEARERWIELHRTPAFKTLATVQSAMSLFEHNARHAETLVTQGAGTSLRLRGVRAVDIDKLVSVSAS